MFQLHQAGWVFNDLRQKIAERVYEPLYGTQRLHVSKDGFTLQVGGRCSRWSLSLIERSSHKANLIKQIYTCRPPSLHHPPPNTCEYMCFSIFLYICRDQLPKTCLDRQMITMTKGANIWAYIVSKEASLSQTKSTMTGASLAGPIHTIIMNKSQVETLETFKL
jgi:hypothetical protein